MNEDFIIGLLNKRLSTAQHTDKTWIKVVLSVFGWYSYYLFIYLFIKLVALKHIHLLENSDWLQSCTIPVLCFTQLIIFPLSSTISQSIASADMDHAQLEAFLTAQTKKQGGGGVTAEQAAALSRFWKSQRVRVKESLLAQSRWEPTLRGLSWRVDLQTAASQGDVTHSGPVALMELELGRVGQVMIASSLSSETHYIFILGTNQYNHSFLLKHSAPLKAPHREKAFTANPSTKYWHKNNW